MRSSCATMVRQCYNLKPWHRPMQHAALVAVTSANGLPVHIRVRQMTALLALSFISSLSLLATRLQLLTQHLLLYHADMAAQMYKQPCHHPCFCQRTMKAVHQGSPTSKAFKCGRIFCRVLRARQPQ